VTLHDPPLLFSANNHLMCDISRACGVAVAFVAQRVVARVGNVAA
jgi:hypothetical protein